MILKKEELLECTGGAKASIVIGAIGLALTFIIGVADGFFRKLKCN